jgi:tripartite-type tricarboxylate transporter receptor subunit TctC
MVMAPTGTPADIIKKLNAAIAEAARDEQVRELAPKLGFELDPKGVGASEDAAEFLKVQLALWAKTSQELGIEPQ